MAADMATKYFTADNGATGAPKVCGVSWTTGAWRVFDPVADTWESAGWPITYMVGPA